MKPLDQHTQFVQTPIIASEFFIAVKTTHIVCRSDCPASPNPDNTIIFEQLHQALHQGYRPCLRCRPESTPQLLSSHLLFNQIIKRVNYGQSTQEITSELDIDSTQACDQIVQDQLGCSITQFKQQQQLLLTKALLHQTTLPLADIVTLVAAKSLTQLAHNFEQIFRLNIEKIRRPSNTLPPSIHLFFAYSPPYTWDLFKEFLAHRLIPGLESLHDDTYSRTFYHQDNKVKFSAHHQLEKQGFAVTIDLSELTSLLPIYQRIEDILDLNNPPKLIEQQLTQLPLLRDKWVLGLRIPGCGSIFEAGIRAILGQQVSVVQAKKLTLLLVEQLGDVEQDMCYFPQPQQVLASDLHFFKMPARRKACLHLLAEYCLQHPHSHDPSPWLDIKGIGPWTIQYAQMRGTKHTDVWLKSDLGIKKALTRFGPIDTQALSPWRSYLTFQLWNLL